MRHLFDWNQRRFQAQQGQQSQFYAYVLTSDTWHKIDDKKGRKPSKLFQK